MLTRGNAVQPSGDPGVGTKGGNEVGARIPERNHRGQIHRLFVSLQEGRRGFAVSSDRPCRQSFLRVEAERSIFLLMEGGDIDQPELVAHPDFIDLDVSVGRDGVLQLSNGRDNHAIDIGTPALNGFPIANVHDVFEHA